MTIMLFYDEPFFHIYFGDAIDAMYPEEYLTWHDASSLLIKPRIQPVVEKLRLQKLFFLHQVHGIDGSVITSEQAALFQPFAHDGDYLITQEPAIGLGIMTADCLPVICFDKRRQAIGIAHAGWRGALAGIVSTMLRAMQREWQTRFADCVIFLGPSAKRCCYQVGAEFREYLEPYPWIEKVLQKQAVGYFFDLPLFVCYQLQALGISKNAMRTSYNTCTMCNDRFYSYRRGIVTKTTSPIGRQMTIIALK